MADTPRLPKDLLCVAPILRQASAAERHLALGDAERLLGEALAHLQDRDDTLALRASLHVSLGRVCASQSKLPSAAQHLEASLRCHRSKYGKKHMLTAMAQHRLGCLYTLQGEAQRAVKHLTDALAVYSAQSSEPSEDVADALLDLGEVQMALGEPSKALATTRKAQAEFRRVGGAAAHNRGYTRALFASGLIREEAGEWQAAKQALEELVQLLQASPVDSPLLTEASLHLANVQLRLNESDEAVMHLEGLLRRLRKERGTGHMDSVKVLIKLATAHMQGEPNHNAAMAFLKAAMAAARKVGPAAADTIAYIQQFALAVEKSAAQLAAKQASQQQMP